MKVILESAEYTDFRGVKKDIIEFGPKENTINLPNKAGKTSRKTGFNWVLFGKDSDGKAQFTVESNNVKKPKTNVTLKLDVDGEKIILSKSPGKWIYNGLEVKKGVFEEMLSNIKSIETMYLLSNPEAFMSLHWEIRRNVLTKLFSEKVSEDSEFSFYMKSMSIADIRKTKTQAKKVANDGLTRCRIIIETHEKSIAEVFDIDFLKLKVELAEKTKEIEELSNFDWENYHSQKSKYNEVERKHASLVEAWKEADKKVKELEAYTYENSKGCAKCGTKIPKEKFEELKKKELILLKTKRENSQNDIIESRTKVVASKKTFESIDQTKPDETTNVLLNSLKEGVKTLNVELAKENNIVTINEKIKAEQARLDAFTAEIMAIEGFMDRFKEFLTNNYYKSINDNFEGLFFDIEDECKLTNSEGTEFKDFSLSERINAGVQIVAVLSKKIGLQFPIWIDNRESVTDLYPIDTQVINLKVKE